MKNEHFLRPDRVEQHGFEQLDLAEKTWPILIPQGMHLAAIVTSEPFGNYSFDVAIDITERGRYERLLNQARSGVWTKIRLFLLSDTHLDACRKRPPT